MYSQYPNYKQTKEQIDYDTLYKWIQIDNLTYREIMHKYHYQERLISKLAKEYGIPYGKARSKIQERKFTDKEKQYIILEYLNGKSARELAKEFNLTHSVILRFLRDNSISIRKAHDIINYNTRRKYEYNEVAYLDSGGYKHTTKINENIRTHRFVMEEYLGRKLSPEEHVHHIDGDKTNNNILNLFLFPNNRFHQLYHSYVNKGGTLSPSEYMDKYKNKINWLYSYETLYDLYINKQMSCNTISKTYSNFSSRNSITRALKKFGIYEMRPPSVNQHDKNLTNNYSYDD